MQPFLEPVERLVLIRDGLHAIDAAVRKRAAMVLQLDRGSNFMRVARSVKCHRNTVKYWYLRYLERRTPAALRPATDVYRRREDQVNHSARARAMVILAESRTGRRLPWSAEERAQVMHDARSAADPAVRYRQAMRFALDRGVPASAIARAASCWTAVVNDLLVRETIGVTRKQRRRAALRGAVANGPHEAGLALDSGDSAGVRVAGDEGRTATEPPARPPAQGAGGIGPPGLDPSHPNAGEGPPRKLRNRGRRPHGAGCPAGGGAETLE